MMQNIVVVSAHRTLDVIVSDEACDRLKAAWIEVMGKGHAIEPIDALYEFPDKRDALHSLDLREVRAISVYPLGDANG